MPIVVPPPSTSRVALSILFAVAGVLHFIFTPAYLRIMPSYLPAPLLLVWISGAAEIGGGLGLLYPQTRVAAAWGLVLLLICVFPANLTMVIDPGRFPTVPLWASWLRLPLQIPLIWWAWLYTRIPVEVQ
jgi:uncharacterized membrane protein